jgi:hypothetical protein
MPDRLVVTVHEAFTPLERRLTGDAGGCCRVDDFHRDVFESSLHPQAPWLRSGRAVGMPTRV